VCHYTGFSQIYRLLPDLLRIVTASKSLYTYMPCRKPTPESRKDRVAID
jgi:hypothetical protein